MTKYTYNQKVIYHIKRERALRKIPNYLRTDLQKKQYDISFGFCNAALFLESEYSSNFMDGYTKGRKAYLSEYERAKK